MNDNEGRKRIEGHEPARIATHEPGRLKEYNPEDEMATAGYAAGAGAPPTADVDNTTPAIRWGAFAMLGLIVAAIIGLFFIHPKRALQGGASPAIALTDPALGNNPGDVTFIDVEEIIPANVVVTALPLGNASRAVAVSPRSPRRTAATAAAVPTEEPKLMAVVDPSTNVVYFFELNGAQVRENAQLNEFASEARQTGSEVNIAAYTDPTGPAEYNRRLSERRARALRDYLVAHGVNPARIDTEAMGPTDKYPTNALDRRAVLTLQ